MRVLFINKFAPPDPAPTALLITDVADVVRDMGGDVSYASSHAGYRGKRRDGWRRWLREAWGNIVLLWLGLTRPRPDIVICLTDPPACLIIATVIARLRRAKLLHWAMDIYPELAVALGELRAGSIVHRALRSGMRWGYKSSAAIACLDQDMIEKLGLAEDARAFISTPWPPSKLVVPEAPPVSSDANVRWLYSGNLGRAHDYETILRAQHRLERDHLPFELVFQGGGACRNSAMEMAAKLRLERCVWRDYVPEERLLESLLETDVLIASQKLETRGLLWPSKLATMLALPRPIVWIGPPDGAAAQLIRTGGGHHGIFASGDDQGLARWLIDSRESFQQQSSYAAAEIKKNLARSREEALRIWRVRLQAFGACPNG